MATQMTQWVQERLGGEEGFTLIEVLIAAVLLVAALLVLVGSLDSERRLGDNAQAQGAASQFAERELDTLLARPYDELALSRIPTNALDGATPTANWTSTRQLLPTAPNDERTDANAAVCSGTQCTSAVPSISNWTSDKPAVRGQVYRYVTWVNDASCPDTNCPGAQDYKRITVAVMVTTASGAIPTVRQGPRVPIVVSAVKINPKLITGNIAGQSTPCDAVGVTCG
jgi:Tfp pilus assembly protein PilV